MQAESAQRIEAGVDRAASTLLAAAAAYSCWALAAGALPQPVRAAVAFAVGVLAFVAAVRLLGAIEPEAQRLPVPVFNVRNVEIADVELPLLPTRYMLPAPEELVLTEQHAPPALQELLLTEAHAPAPVEEWLPAGLDQAPEPEEPLVLDDVIAQLAPDSRVVRLFDPVAMPTAGELNQRIERHLVRGAAPAAPADASQALHEALAELRRSLR